MTDNESTPVETSVEQAASQIAGLLDMTPTESAPDKRRTSSEPAPVDETDDQESPEEGDDAPHESEASVDTDDDTNDPADEPDEDSPPAIDPPSSWPADQRAKFKELPTELQEFVVQRETERDRAVNRKVSELAEQRKAAEVEIARVSQSQQNYTSVLNQLLSMTVPELQQIESTDFVALAQSNPNEYIRLSALRDGLRQRVGYMQSQMNQVQQEQQQRALSEHQEHLVHQYHTLVEQVPEFGQPDKAKALVSDITNTMSRYGFSDQELNSIADARIVRVLSRLTQLERKEAARTSAQSKKTSVQAPRSMTPNAVPSRETNQKRDLKEQYAQLRKTGSIRDAARLIENMR